MTVKNKKNNSVEIQADEKNDTFIKEPISKSPNNSNNKSILIMSIDDIIPYEKNPRIISASAVDKVANSIKEFGFLNPIIVDKDNIIVAGHTRLKACKKLGIEKVPVIKAEHLTPKQVQAYRIADNRTGEEATWDKELLAIEIDELKDLSTGEYFDISLTGFDLKELEVLNNLKLSKELDNESSDEDNYNIPEVNEEEPPITKKGDIWLLGKHKLMCGDATKFSDIEKLMNGELADMVFTDPPYNIQINEIIGIGKIKHDEFAMASGEMTEKEYTDFLKDVFTNYIATSHDGSIHYVCIDWKHIYELLTAGREIYTEYKQLCVWNKDNGGMGGFYRSKHELIFVFKKGKIPNTNNFELGQYGRYRSNVWDYPAINSFAGRELVINEKGMKVSGTCKELEMHPTVKPLKMVIDAILDCSNENDLISDFFLGSGTTLIAAEKTNRRCYGMEISPHFCDIIIKRWQEATGEIAKLQTITEE